MTEAKQELVQNWLTKAQQDLVAAHKLFLLSQTFQLGVKLALA